MKSIVILIGLVWALVKLGPVPGGLGLRRRSLVIWEMVARGPLGARPSVLTSVPMSTWAVLRRFGVKFPGSSALLTDKDTPAGFRRRSVSANRYLAHQFLRLEKAAEARNMSLYWTVAWQLISKSKAYRMAVLHKALPFWYWKLTSKRMDTILRRVQAIVDAWDSNLITVRMYILKADGIRYRPLGVPALEWRLVIALWTPLLTTWLRPCLSSHQYGAKTGFGPADAWLTILREVVTSPDIFEYDLAGFFNSFSLKHLHKLLGAYGGLPQTINNYLFDVNSNNPLPPKGSLPMKDDPELGEVKSETLSKVMNQRVVRSVRHRYYAEWWHAWRGTKLSGRFWDSPILGIPQGTGWAVIMATFILEYSGLYKPWMPPSKYQIVGWEGWNGETWKTVQFIDDGLWYGKFHRFVNGQTPLDWLQAPHSVFNLMGLKFSTKPGATGFVRREGQWLKPLTYLGLTYNPDTDTLSGSRGRHGTRQELLTLAAQDMKAFRARVMGLKPGFSGSAPPEEWLRPAVPREIEPESALGRFSLRYALDAPRVGAFYCMIGIWIAVADLTFIWATDLDSPLGWGVQLVILPLVGAFIYWPRLPGPTFHWTPLAGRNSWIPVDWSASSTHFACVYLPKCIKLKKQRARRTLKKA